MSTGGFTDDEASWVGGARIGRYTLVNRVGRGGMGEVWLATQTGAGGFQKRVALKRIADRMSSDLDAERMFVDEAKLAAHLSHPYIVQVFDFGTHDDAYFLAMELLEGDTLEALMGRARAAGQHVPLGVAVRLLAQAADALHYAHTRADPNGAPLQIVHRDVSPSNLFVTLDGKLKVLDFGIARATVRRNLTAVGMIRGKLAYMAPEQVLGKRLDARADQYALGVVLFEWLTGQRLCPAKTLDAATAWASAPDVTAQDVLSARADVPVALAEVIARAVAKDRERRFPSCAELGAALEQVAAESRLQATHADILRWVEGHTSATTKTAARVEPETVSVAAIVAAPTPQHTPSEPETLPSHTIAASPAAVRRRTLKIPLEPEPARPKAVRSRAVVALAALLLAATAGAWFLAANSGGKQEPKPEPAALARVERETRSEATPVPSEPPPSEPRDTQPVDPPPPEATPTDAPQGATVPAEPPVEVESKSKAEEAPKQAEPAETERKEAARSRSNSSGREKRRSSSPALGRVTLDSIPWSRVTMNGKELGVTPLVEHEVPAGRHTFRFVNEDGTLTGELRVRVPRGGKIARRITLAPRKQ